MSTKQLLLIAHAPSPNLSRLRDALLRGAHAGAEGEALEVLSRSPFEVEAEALLVAQAYLLLTPENLGYMSGALKDLFDRTYYGVLEQTQARPYALVIRAGNDGTGTRRAVESIAGAGLRWKAVAPPLICKGAWDERWPEQCEALGATLAAGLAMGVF